MYRQVSRVAAVFVVGDTSSHSNFGGSFVSQDALAPLDGVRIVDLTQVGAGPYCTTLLGDLGADVIKVEPPGGEPMRSVDNHFAPKESAYYFGINRSKRDITLNLKSEAGRAILDRLIDSADVFAVG